MKKLIAFGFLLGLAACAGSITTVIPPTPNPIKGTHVRLMRGLGGAALSPGVDQIAAMAAKVPGVTLVRVYEYFQTQQIADEVNAEPMSVREVIGGYSCGANASPVAAAGLNRTVDMVTVIQASLWCGGTALGTNVLAAQETYNDNCAETAGLGCKLLDMAPGFNPNHFTVILRPDCHPCADVDPDAQNDMILAIKRVTNPTVAHKFGSTGSPMAGSTHLLIRYHGQVPY